jgi:glycosyltransferase involved in cell wall biosynthesis
MADLALNSDQRERTIEMTLTAGPRTRAHMAETAVLIPALNCGATIGAVVSAARRYVPYVLVVSDGSTDATVAEAVAAGAQIVTHDRPRGKGAALLTGMRALAERGVRRVVTMDGDGQHLGDEIPVLLSAADAGPGALIIGARRFEEVSSTPIRLFGNRFANRWVEIACGQRLPDTQSGFRVYPLRETVALRVRARHFAFETEVLIRAVRAGMEIRSVPVRVYYPPIAERISHFRGFVDTVRIIFVVLGLIFRVW